MAAIFDFRHTRTSESIPTSFNVLPDPENIGIAVGISLLSCIEADIIVVSFLLRLMATIFDFRHTQTPDSLHNNSDVLPDPENMGIAVEISLLSCLEA